MIRFTQPTDPVHRRIIGWAIRLARYSNLSRGHNVISDFAATHKQELFHAAFVLRDHDKPNLAMIVDLTNARNLISRAQAERRARP
jgi:hypothetical protein